MGNNRTTQIKLTNLKQHILTTEKQYETTLRYAALLKRDLIKSKKRLAQRLSKTVGQAGGYQNATE